MLWQAVWSGIMYLPGIVIAATLTITRWLVIISGAVANWVIGPKFITWGYVHNPVTKVGLGITQQFVNLGLVAVLIVIALLIALNYKSFDGKKILIRLIIIALLVNFAPVLVGLIVDATNIIMNYFSAGIQEGITEMVSGSDWNIFRISEEIRKVNNFQTKAGILTRGVILIQLNLLLFLIFSITASMFFARHIAIWILVILSPIAFVAWVLPQTKKFWDMWWQQLIQWSILGIPIMFFIYLAAATFGALSTAFGSRISSGTNDPIGNAYLDDVFPFLVVSALISVGFMVGLKTSAMGASSIIGTAINTKKRVQSWAGKKAWQGINLPDRAIHITKEGKTITARTLARGLANQWDRAPVLRWFRPEPLKKFGEQEPLIQSMKKEITGDSGDEMDRVASGKYHGVKAAAAVHAIIKDRGDSQDFVKAYGRKYKHMNKDGTVDEKALFDDDRFLNDETATRAMEYLDNAGMKGKALRADPRLCMVGVKLTKEEREEALKGLKTSKEKDEALEKAKRKKGAKEVRRRAIDAKTTDFSIMEREVLDNDMMFETFLAYKDETHFRVMAGLKGGGVGRQHRFNKVFSDWVDKNKLDEKDDKGNYKKYLEYLSKEYHVETPGIESVLENPRMEGLGYHKPEFISKEERKHPPGDDAISEVLFKRKPRKEPGESKPQTPEEKIRELREQWRKELQEEKQTPPPPPPPPSPEPPKPKDGYIPGSGMGPGKRKK